MTETPGEPTSGPVRLVTRNRWRDVVPDPSVAFEPTLSVSVVIPAYNCAETLPWTLAALAHQTYPAHLLEVVVADDGSEPPLELPDERPENTRLVRSDGSGWGRAYACHLGATRSTGDVVLFLDSDMVPWHDHVEAHARVHHLLDDAVTIGHKLFVADWSSASYDDLLVRARAHDLATLFAQEDAERHWIEDVFARTDALHDGDANVFSSFTGATGAMRRSTYEGCGGMDTELRLGEDTELAYRLAQRGAVFVPETQSSSWHLGPPTVVTAGEASRRWNRPHLAQRMAQPRHLRASSGRAWPVPLVHAVVDLGDGRTVPYDVARMCVDRLLASDEEDLAVSLVAPWGELTYGRRGVLRDPLSDLHLLHEWFRTEPRVHVVEQAPQDVFPSPFRLDVPATAGVERQTVRRLLTAAGKKRLGVVRVLAPGREAEDALRLTRTAARSRALRHVGRDDDHALAEVWGLAWLDGTTAPVLDLREADAETLRRVVWSRNTDDLVKALTKSKATAKALRRQLAGTGKLGLGGYVRGAAAATRATLRRRVGGSGPTP
jgi:GT2 family glycosyltransferase